MFTSGLCLLEPQLSAGTVDGAMIPANWVRPRFHIAPPTGIDPFEIRIHSPAELNDLVIYTTATDYYLPKEYWSGSAGDAGTAAGNGFANNAAGQAVTVTVRGVNSASPGTPVGISGDFNIAPAIVTGAMVFWTVNSSSVTPQSSQLLGFAVGDEGVQPSLTLPQVLWTGEIGEDGSVLRGYYDNPQNPLFQYGQVRCIGCHTSTPDGQTVVFTDDWPWSKVAATISGGTVGAIPGFITVGAQDIMRMPWWGTQSTSKEHWATGDQIVLTSYGYMYANGALRTTPWQGLQQDSTGAYSVKIKTHELAWINLAANAPTPINVTVTGTPNYGNVTAMNTAATAAKGTVWGLINTGDSLSTVSDVMPSMMHNGDTIVYTATDDSRDGHPDYLARVATLRTVPYNNRLGGTSAALNGAASSSYLQYYPSYSPDDNFVIFSRAPAPAAATDDGPYYNRNGEIAVVPAGGGTATRLVASDAIACAGNASPNSGLVNSWPKWAPDYVSNKNTNKTYYFVVFSSGRAYGDEFSSQFQLPANTASDFAGVRNSSQLYLAAIVLDNTTGVLTTYPAVYIWNQNRTPSGATTFSNLTPAWAAFTLPPLVIASPVNNTPK